MKETKNISLFLIPYFTICGTLYHIAFWDTFKLNGLSYISISDIIKSAVQPIFYVFLSSIITSFFYYYVFQLDKVFPSGGGSNTKTGKALNSRLGIIILMLVWATFQYLIFYFDINPYRWNNWVIFTSIPIWIFLINQPSVIDTIPDNRLRLICIQSAIYLPLFCFATGKKDSEIIHKNIRFKYSIRASKSDTTTIKSDTLKFIGCSSQNVFFTDLKNSTIFILNSNIDTLILKTKE